MNMYMVSTTAIAVMTTSPTAKVQVCRGLVAGAAILLVVMGRYAGAATIYVSADGSHGSPFETWGQAAHDIQSAVDVAIAGDTVLVSNGTYSVTNQVSVTNAVTVLSLAGATNTTVKRIGSSYFRVFYVAHSNAVLDGFTVRNGYETGGGVYCYYGGTVQNCIITDNHAPNNKAGAGVYLYRGGTVQSCTIIENTMGDYSGAGVYCYQGGLVQNCLIKDNICRRYGGGVYLNAGGTVRNCMIVGNTSGTGATAGLGGGIFCNSIGCVVQNCTIVDNTAKGSGGGVYLNGGGLIENSILRLNTAPLGADYIASGNGWGFSYSCTTPDPGGAHNITDDPEFINADTGDYQLLAGSPCIDSGSNQTWMTGDVDLDGNDRILGGTVDRGVYEFAAGALACNAVALSREGFVSKKVVFTSYVVGTDTNGLYYKWDFDNNGSYDREGGDKRVVTNTYPAGLFDVRLVVRNGIGSEATVTKEDYIKVGPATAYVSDAGTHDQPYTNWATAAADIQSAVDAGVAGTVVLVTNGTYTITEQVTVADGITVRSVGGASNTVVKRTGSATHRIFYLNHTDAVVDGFTITNGYENGGGIYIAWSGTVQNCVITGNRAPNNCNGAGLYLAGGGFVTNCTITGNTMGDYNGGGMIMSGGVVSNCRIVGNRASYGGGLYCSGGLVENCMIQSNATVRAAVTGGGLRLAGGTVRNCLISGNTSPNTAGGVSCWGGTIQNCTIVSNEAGLAAGGIYNTGAAIENSIVYFNVASLGVNYTNSGSTWSYSFCCTTPGVTGAGNITNDPAFEDVAVGDYHLHKGSPCIDAGTNLVWMTAGVDLEENPRLQARAVDIGAYEFMPPRGTVLFIGF